MSVVVNLICIHLWIISNQKLESALISRFIYAHAIHCVIRIRNS